MSELHWPLSPEVSAHSKGGTRNSAGGSCQVKDNNPVLTNFESNKKVIES
jgi:hypothetical protein